VPLLWVIPLALYLATYSAAFGLGRPPNSPTLLVVYVTALAVFFSPFLTTSPLSPGVGLLIAMTAGCLVCHIELVRSRPAPEKLPRFYRCLALGGALGGLFAGVAAPVVFNQTFELALALITPPLIHRWSKDRNSPNRLMRYAPVAIFSAALLALIVYDHIEQRSGSTTTSFTRNFYGVLKVVERNTERPPYREFSHGSTVHGIQRLDPPHLLSPGTYYGPSSGIGRAIKSFNDRPIVVGAIGLGVGTVAVYAKPGDHYYFFELNPAVIPIAREKFSFLSQSQGTIELSLGDGRLAIERWSGQPFDILFLDAFSGDSIPTHLLTEEALASFEKKLSPEGILIVHISNRYVDLQPVLGTVADKLGLHAALFEDPGSPPDLQWPSQHVLLTRSAKILTHPELRSAGTSIRTRTPLWTDNYSSVWRVFKSPL
jgi:hypothetical protein